MLGDKLKDLREKRDLTQKDVADKIGVANTTIGMYENNKREPDIETIKSLAVFFDVSMDWLTGHVLTSTELVELEQFRETLVRKGVMSKDQELTLEEFNNLIEVFKAIRPKK